MENARSLLSISHYCLLLDGTREHVLKLVHAPDRAFIFGLQHPLDTFPTELHRLYAFLRRRGAISHEIALRPDVNGPEVVHAKFRVELLAVLAAGISS